MNGFGGMIARGLAMAGKRSPWGSGGDGGDDGAGGEGSGAGAGRPKPDRPTGVDEGRDKPRGPRNPWLPASDEVPPRRAAGLDDILRQRGGGGGGGKGGGGFPRLPQRPDGKSWVPAIVGLVVAGWFALSATHMLGPKEQGIVTTFGKYTRTIGAGVSVTLPWPLQNVTVREVTSIERFMIPDNEGEKLMLTSDQNLVNLSYLVRWNIKDLKLYNFQVENPDETVKEVAEAAMRASVAEVPLRNAMGGSGRAEIEFAVRRRMQGVLDAYRSGVQIQGVDIRKADPPSKVVEAFQQVTVTQQEAQRDMSNARAYAQQVIARAQGEATEFDKIYAQYKLAPQVTRQRLYYQTMERVLRDNDKVVIEANGVTPYLPLPQMQRPVVPAVAAPAAGGR